MNHFVELVNVDSYMCHFLLPRYPTMWAWNGQWDRSRMEMPFNVNRSIPPFLTDWSSRWHSGKWINLASFGLRSGAVDRPCPCPPRPLKNERLLCLAFDWLLRFLDFQGKVFENNLHSWMDSLSASCQQNLACCDSIFPWFCRINIR